MYFLFELGIIDVRIVEDISFWEKWGELIAISILSGTAVFVSIRALLQNKKYVEKTNKPILQILIRDNINSSLPINKKFEIIFENLGGGALFFKECIWIYRDKSYNEFHQFIMKSFISIEDVEPVELGTWVEVLNGRAIKGGSSFVLYSIDVIPKSDEERLNYVKIFRHLKNELNYLRLKGYFEDIYGNKTQIDEWFGNLL